jgi:exopolysaccharide production protein ExoY
VDTTRIRAEDPLPCKSATAWVWWVSYGRECRGKFARLLDSPTGNWKTGIATERIAPEPDFDFTTFLHRVDQTAANPRYATNNSPMAFQSTYASPCAQRVEESGLWRAVGWGERLEAVLLLTALGPFLIATGVAIVVLSRRSPLVAHRRVGLRGRPFWTLKFRSMWPCPGGAQFALIERVVEDPGPDPKAAADPRVTNRFARICRRYSIDELPQLVNVVRGEMALVGPRPLTREEMRAHYAAAAPEVLSVKPGITGLWQVMGRSRLSYPQRRRLDLFLVRKRSARLYLAILLRTLPEVLAGRNSW